jgi:hypothetical protein
MVVTDTYITAWEPAATPCMTVIAVAEASTRSYWDISFSRHDMPQSNDWRLMCSRRTGPPCASFPDEASRPQARSAAYAV